MCCIIWLECWLWTVALNMSYILGITLLQAWDRIISSLEKWIKFTYFIPQIQTITNLFKHTNPYITFHTTNTICNFFKIEISTNTNVYGTSGIYSLTCITCHLNYMGQTGQSLKQRTFVIYSVQQSTISVCKSYSTKRMWIWTHAKYSVCKSYSTKRTWIWTHAKYSDINTPSL
jgi:hypothetical protein